MQQRRKCGHWLQMLEPLLIPIKKYAQLDTLAHKQHRPFFWITRLSFLLAPSPMLYTHRDDPLRTCLRTWSIEDNPCYSLCPLGAAYDLALVYGTPWESIPLSWRMAQIKPAEPRHIHLTCFIFFFKSGKDCYSENDFCSEYDVWKLISVQWISKSWINIP